MPKNVTDLNINVADLHTTKVIVIPPKAKLIRTIKILFVWIWITSAVLVVGNSDEFRIIFTVVNLYGRG